MNSNISELQYLFSPLHERNVSKYVPWAKFSSRSRSWNQSCAAKMAFIQQVLGASSLLHWSVLAIYSQDWRGLSYLDGKFGARDREMSARAALVNNKAVKGKLTELSAHFLLASYRSFELGRYYLIIYPLNMYSNWILKNLLYRRES